MAFQSLTEKLKNAFKKFRNKGKLTEADVKEGMREIKLALLEADVNFKVVKEFIKKVTERAVGSEVLESLLPAQQVVKIVNEELIELMGKSQAKLEISSKPPTVIMMVGLQGAGKTTHSAKIAGLYKKQGKNPLLVACDVYRPAAIKQLQVVCQQLSIPVYADEKSKNPVSIAKDALNFARKNGNDMVFIDTAGRLHVDEVLMKELQNIKDATSPTEILLVVDAMLGQDALTVAESFDQMLNISGIVLTKLDGDTRGGAALSVRYVTGKPIKFVGTGEKLDTIEPFYPDRMASRILGMGDVLSLIEKAEEAFDKKKAEELEKKMKENTFTLVDYLDQLDQLKKMGSLDSVLAMIPGAPSDLKVDENMLVRTEAIILSMTPKERENPDIISSSRKKRISKGSGTTVEEINRLLKQFDQMKKMMKQISSGKFNGFGGFGGKKFKMPFKK